MIEKQESVKLHIRFLIEDQVRQSLGQISTKIIRRGSGLFIDEVWDRVENLVLLMRDL